MALSLSEVGERPYGVPGCGNQSRIGPDNLHGPSGSDFYFVANCRPERICVTPQKYAAPCAVVTKIYY
jgi:hypothetical protein